MQKIHTCTITPVAILGILTIVLVMSGGCTDGFSQGNSTLSSSGSSGCSPGYNKYSTSSGHCCRPEYPYYYDGYCQACPVGYAQYQSSNGHCCAEGYPYYYDGSCWNQPAGSGTNGGGTTGSSTTREGTTGGGTTGGSTTSGSTTAGVTTGSSTPGLGGGMQIVAGKGCPSGTYYYQGACWKESAGSGTAGSGTTTQTTYYASCSQCKGQYPLYSYRGPSYAVCNNYYQTCVQAGCEKILDNCR